MSYKRLAVQKALQGDTRFLEAISDGKVSIALIDDYIKPVKNQTVDFIISDTYGYLESKTKINFEKEDNRIKVNGHVDDLTCLIVQSIEDRPIDEMLSTLVKNQASIMVGDSKVTIEPLTYKAHTIDFSKLTKQDAVHDDTSIHVVDDSELLEHDPLLEDNINDNNNDHVNDDNYDELIQNDVVNDYNEDYTYAHVTEEDSQHDMQAVFKDLLKTIKDTIRDSQLDKKLGITL